MAAWQHLIADVQLGISCQFENNLLLSVVGLGPCLSFARAPVGTDLYVFMEDCV